MCIGYSLYLKRSFRWQVKGWNGQKRGGDLRCGIGTLTTSSFLFFLNFTSIWFWDSNCREDHLLGIAVGHVYYFFEDWTMIYACWGERWWCHIWWYVFFSGLEVQNLQETPALSQPEDIYPRLPTSKGFRLFRTPELLKWVWDLSFRSFWAILLSLSQPERKKYAGALKLVMFGRLMPWHMFVSLQGDLGLTYLRLKTLADPMLVLFPFAGLQTLRCPILSIQQFSPRYAAKLTDWTWSGQLAQ